MVAGALMRPPPVRVSPVSRVSEAGSPVLPPSRLRDCVLSVLVLRPAVLGMLESERACGTEQSAWAFLLAHCPLNAYACVCYPITTCQQAGVHACPPAAMWYEGKLLRCGDGFIGADADCALIASGWWGDGPSGSITYVRTTYT